MMRAPKTARASRGCMSSGPRWTPSAPAARATSTRSFTMKSAPYSCARSRSDRASAMRRGVGSDFSRNCTTRAPPRGAAGIGQYVDAGDRARVGVAAAIAGDDGVVQARGDDLFGSRDGDAERNAQSQIRSDRSRERAAGAVRVWRRYARAGVRFDESAVDVELVVGIAGGVAAFDEDSAGMAGALQ